MITIKTYIPTDRPHLLRLLLELQSDYFRQSASSDLQELERLHDINKTYDNYISFIEQSKEDTWQIYLAVTKENRPIGFIIGSIETDDDLVLSKIGKVEDWYVEEESRGQEIGLLLYNVLESWFKEKGCCQIHSETWEGNQPSIKSHQRCGFFISEIKFKKKID